MFINHKLILGDEDVLLDTMEAILKSRQLEKDTGKKGVRQNEVHVTKRGNQLTTDENLMTEVVVSIILNRSG